MGKESRGQREGKDVGNVQPLRPKDEIDAWKFDYPGEYDRNECYTRGTDRDGNKEQTRVAFTPRIWGQINEVAFSRVIPQLNSPHKLIRNAVYHELHRIAEMVKDGNLQQVVDGEIIAHRKEMRKARVVQARANLAAIEDLFKTCWDEQDYVELEAAIEETEGELEMMSAPYQDQAGRLVDQYRGMLKSK